MIHDANREYKHPNLKVGVIKPTGPPSARDGGSGQALSADHRNIDDLAAEIRALRTEVERLGSQTAELRGGFGELKTQDSVLAQMHDECRLLRERFHDREVLKPLFFNLIGVADRCRREIATQRGSLAQLAARTPQKVQTWIHSLIRARKADLVEIEACLAIYGIRPFQHHGPRFDPKTQHCDRTVRTGKPELIECIATRLLPGYCRGSDIIRKECVELYVLDNHHKKGVA